MNDKRLNHPKYNIALRVIFAILAIGVMLLIFYMSEQNAKSSSSMSGSFIKTLAQIIDRNFSLKTAVEQQNIISSFQFIVRKSAHFMIYLFLGIFVSGFFSTFKMKLLSNYICSQCICSFYSVTDEFHQRFSQGRSCELRDVLIDSAGSLCGIILVLIILKLGGNKMKKGKLLENIELLSERLQRADGIITGLKTEITEKDREINALKNRICELENQIASKQEEKAEMPEEKPEQAPEQTPEQAPEQAPEQTSAPVDFQSVSLNVPASEDCDINEYAVKAISAIVTESVKINCTLASGNGEDRKELINLVLGRSEVAKEEISNLLATGLDTEAIRASIDKEKASALEYFSAVLGQL